MFFPIQGDIFILISFASYSQINRGDDLLFPAGEPEPELLLTVMKYMFKKEKRINFSCAPRLTTSAQSTITTFKGLLTLGGGDLWPFLGLFYEDFFKTLTRWLNYQRVFLWEKSAGWSAAVYFFHCAALPPRVPTGSCSGNGNICATWKLV